MMLMRFHVSFLYLRVHELVCVVKGVEVVKTAYGDLVPCHIVSRINPFTNLLRHLKAGWFYLIKFKMSFLLHEYFTLFWYSKFDGPRDKIFLKD